jgi:hypothetical protein
MSRRDMKRLEIMIPIDIADIESQARQLRAEEMKRIESHVAAFLAVYLRLAATAMQLVLKVVSVRLQPLFSWNPQRTAANLKG